MDGFAGGKIAYNHSEVAPAAEPEHIGFRAAELPHTCGGCRVYAVRDDEQRDVGVAVIRHGLDPCKAAFPGCVR